MKNNKLEKILLIPDCHFPYQDKKAFELMLKIAKDFRPDYVVILGDFIDCYSISSHSKNPNRALKLKEEVEKAKKGLDELKLLGAKNNIFIEGNHEDRLKRYLEKTAPELFDFISIPKILELKEKGFKHVPYKESYKIGKLNLTHDVGNAGRFAHYKALDAFQHNIVTGHTHRLGYIVEGNAKGERHLSTMLGWLGDLNEIDYMFKVQAIKNWSLGFGVAYLDKNTDNIYVTPIPIVNYTALHEGKLYTLNNKFK